MPRARKPKIFPATIVCDTREQAPFAFLSIDPWDQIPTVKAALPTGDYSLQGFESRVVIERKSISDFYHSIGSDRERFEREMVRLQKMEYAAVVIEGDWRELLVDRPDTIQMHKNAATGTISSWSIRYGVHFWLPGSRRDAEKLTFILLWHWWKQEQERLNELAWIDDAIDEIFEPALF